MIYRDLSELVVDCAEIFRPVDRVSVGECAENHRVIYNPGSYIGPWTNDTTAYLVEVMNTLPSRYYQEFGFCKPAQCGGTETILNFLLYVGLIDPADVRFYEKSETDARQFGKTKLAKMVNHCPDLKVRLLPGKAGRQAHALRFRSGIEFKLSWPSENQLAGHSTGINLLTDFDRMPENVGGEGDAFTLATTRGTSFGSFATTYAESSPSREITERNWRNTEWDKFPHLSPPCSGILDIYNGGDRRRWYWPCPHCGCWFEGSFSLLSFDKDSPDPEAAAEKVVMACIACGSPITPDVRNDLNALGVWIRERDFVALNSGHKYIPANTPKKRGKEWEIALHKPEPYSNRATWWLKGPAAAFMQWKTMVEKYMRAYRTWENTGDYQPLRATVNTNQCEPFELPTRGEERTADELQDRANVPGEGQVPEDVRCLFILVDVQKRSFEYAVCGIRRGGDIVVIERANIWKSYRTDDDDDRLPIQPATYLEDWKVLEELLDKRYPLSDGSGRSMAVRAMACDSGGSKSAMGSKSSTTEKAYKFYRYLKRKKKHARFHLWKGGSNPNHPRLQVTYPDSERKDRFAGARGDIPIMLMNANLLKDAVDGMLDSQEPGTGMVEFSKSLPASFYEELVAEVRDPKKGWIKIKPRNEGWDLLVACFALMIRLKLDVMDWDNPYAWVETWDKNSLVVGNKPADKDTKQPSTLSEMTRDLI